MISVSDCGSMTLVSELSQEVGGYSGISVLSGKVKVKSAVPNIYLEASSVNDLDFSMVTSAVIVSRTGLGTS